MSATKTMTFKEFLEANGLNKDLTKTEKDVAYATVFMLVLLVVMVVGNFFFPVTVPAYIHL